MKNYCPNSDQGLMVDPAGDITPCCKVINVPSFKIQDGVKKYYDSEWYKTFKKAHLNDERHPACSRCYDEEDNGFKSKRNIDSDKLGSGFNYDKKDNLDIKNFEMTFGNLCNLACRICFPLYSSKWATEKRKIDGKKYPIYTWHQDKDVMQEIYDIIKKVERITIVGGEPFLIEINEHSEFLKHLIDIDQAKNITLHYVTNGTNYPTPELLIFFKSFKKIDIQLSIDDIGERFEYNRWPAKWSKVYSNIKKYQTLKKENKNINLSISLTISAFTIYYVDDFVLWCLKEKLPFPYFNQLTYSIYNRASVFKKETKNIIRKKLLSSKSKKIKNLVSWLDQSDDSGNFGKFEEQVQLIDKMRKQNFTKTFSGLHKIL